MKRGVRIIVAAVVLVVVLFLATVSPPEPLDGVAVVADADATVQLETTTGGHSNLDDATSNANGAPVRGESEDEEEVREGAAPLEGSDPNNKMKHGQLQDENKLEDALPPLDETLEVALNTSSRQIFNDEATMKIPLTIGVLTVPGLIRSRLIPLLESSLKHEKDIHVFFMDTPKTLPGRELLRDYLLRVKRLDEVHIVRLPKPKSMKMALRNAWVNLPAIQYFRVARPHQKYFAIMDDDTYFLMNGIRRMLRDVDTNSSHVGKPVYMGAPITDGLRGGCRLVRSGKTKRAFHTTGRKEVVFVCGGSGILMDRLAMDELFKIRNVTVSPTETYYDYCIDTMFQGAGDVRLGHCLSEANVPIITRREMFRDTMFRAIGEKRVYNKYEFPASFHRFRRREWQYALRAVEDAREPNELVTWGDLLKNFQPGQTFWHSMFYPMKYDNYTDIMGLKKKTGYQLRREAILQRKYHCGRKVNTDEW